MLLFSCLVWVWNNKSNITVDITYGVAREIGEKVYCNDINSHICEDVYEETPNCPEYKNIVLINLRCIGANCYSPGEDIIDDLNELRMDSC